MEKKGVGYMEMIICDPDKNECHLMESYVHEFYMDKGFHVQVRQCGDWQELCSQIRKKGADIVIVAQEGVKGLDIMTGLKVSAMKRIWFSDLDFGVQAYRLNVSYFNMLPVTREKIFYALQNLDL